MGADLLTDVEADQNMTNEEFWKDAERLFRRVPWHVWNDMDYDDQFAYDSFVINLIRRGKLKAEKESPKGL
jgi:hypothetical protein